MLLGLQPLNSFISKEQQPFDAFRLKRFRIQMRRFRNSRNLISFAQIDTLDEADKHVFRFLASIFPCVMMECGQRKAKATGMQLKMVLCLRCVRAA
jgi:hypothetical protein